MVCGMAAEEQRVRQLSVVLSSVIIAQSSLFDGCDRRARCGAVSARSFACQVIPSILENHGSPSTAGCGTGRPVIDSGAGMN
jgi:hypothetical protein